MILTEYYKSSTSIKPSSIGFQISKLAQKFHVNEDGIEKLILQFEGSPPPDSAGEIKAVPGPYRPKINRRESLYTKFQSTDGVNYTSKYEKYRSSFSVRRDGVSFTNPNEISIKAGIQALLEQGSKGPFQVTGPEVFKRKAWLVSAMMGLEVANYKPSQSDLKALYERVKANQEKYPKAKIKLLEAHLDALKKEGLDFDRIFNEPVSLSDLFPERVEAKKLTPLVKQSAKSLVSPSPEPTNKSTLDKAIKDAEIDQYLKSHVKKKGGYRR